MLGRFVFMCCCNVQFYQILINRREMNPIKEESLDMDQEPMEVEEDFNDQEAILEMEAEQMAQEMEEHSQRMIEKLGNEQQADPEEKLQPIKNPISPYMMFVKNWKQNHPEEKFSVTAMGQIWKTMSVSEKQPYEAEYRERKQQYDEYQASVQIGGQASSEASAPKNLFPLHRIRAIMKQDSYYSAKVEATVAMAKATQYFAEFFLEEIKKLTEGKNRIDAKVLYDCINNNRSMTFLECLIQEYNKESNEAGKQKKPKPEVRLEFEDSPNKISKAQKAQNMTAVRPQPKPKQKPSGKEKPAGQMSLDFFVSKQR